MSSHDMNAARALVHRDLHNARLSLGPYPASQGCDTSFAFPLCAFVSALA
jgi:hypothetical protein